MAKKTVRVSVKQPTTRAVVTTTANKVTVSTPSSGAGSASKATVFGYGPPGDDVPRNVLYLDMNTGNLYEFGGN